MTKYIKPSEYADIKGVTKRTVINWIKAGKLEARKTQGGHYRIPYNKEFHGTLPSYTSNIMMKKLCSRHGTAVVKSVNVENNELRVHIRATNNEARMKMLRTFAGGMSADEGYEIGNCPGCIEYTDAIGDVVVDNNELMMHVGDLLDLLLDVMHMRIQEPDGMLGFNFGPFNVTLKFDKTLIIEPLHDHEYDLVAGDELLGELVEDEWEQNNPLNPQGYQGGVVVINVSDDAGPANNYTNTHVTSTASQANNQSITGTVDNSGFVSQDEGIEFSQWGQLLQSPRASGRTLLLDWLENQIEFHSANVLIYSSVVKRMYMGYLSFMDIRMPLDKPKYLINEEFKFSVWLAWYDNVLEGLGLRWMVNWNVSGQTGITYLGMMERYVEHMNNIRGHQFGQYSLEIELFWGPNNREPMVHSYQIREGHRLG